MKVAVEVVNRLVKPGLLMLRDCHLWDLTQIRFKALEFLNNFLYSRGYGAVTHFLHKEQVKIVLIETKNNDKNNEEEKYPSKILKLLENNKVKVGVWIRKQRWADFLQMLKNILSAILIKILRIMIRVVKWIKRIVFIALILLLLKLLFI